MVDQRDELMAVVNGRVTKGGNTKDLDSAAIKSKNELNLERQLAPKTGGIASTTSNA